MRNQVTDKKMTDKGGKPIVCLKSDNGNPTYVSNGTKAINIKCLSPQPDKGHKKPLSGEDPGTGFFANKKVRLTKSGCKMIVKAAVDAALEDWWDAMTRLEQNCSDQEALNTVDQVEEFFESDLYELYREFAVLPDNPLDMIKYKWINSR